ncbi:MAG: phosphatase PAP2 family protein [Ilumatobacter sp.]|uniref:phosphatase PAP2 family protein n=1 Tax=Ilumatobacter sp. TaxID=1967498 RepID=UPI003299CF08
MLLGLASGGLWSVWWIALAVVLVVGGLSAILRSAGLEWVRIRRILIGVYAIGYVSWFAINGIIIDRISVLLSFAIFLGVASVGRSRDAWRRTATDLGLFVMMWVAYDESRGVADELGMPIQVESVRDIDRFLLFGRDGSVALQERFLAPVGTVRWYDVVASCVYYSHFIVPPIALGVLWWRNRDEWVRYMRRFATLMLVACTMFVLLPTAPPWMAAGGSTRPGFRFDALPALRRPTGNGWEHIGLRNFVEAWDTGRDWANDVAAMPSLHAAYALFVVAFFWPKIRSPWIRAALVAYPTSMAAALVYFGEHYLTDALVGWAVVGLSFLVWNRVETRHRSSGDVDTENGANSDVDDEHNAPVAVAVADGGTDGGVAQTSAGEGSAAEVAADGTVPSVSALR